MKISPDGVEDPAHSFVTGSKGAGEQEMTNAIREIAAAWFARLSGGFATPTDRARFQEWLAAAPAHAAAYAEFDTVWAATEQLRAAIPSVPLPTARRRTGTRVAAAVALAATVALVAFLPPVRDLWQLDRYDTAAGEQRTVRLADGTSVHLDGATSIEVRMRDDRRRVSLVAGEALFDVIKDANRPFLVELGDRTVRVVGTVFDVRRAGQQVTVAVAEGKVKVGDAADAAAAAKIELVPGQRARFDDAAVAGEVSAVPVDRVGSWRQDVLYYDRASVGEIVADLNRRFVPAIAVSGPKLAEMRVHTTLVVQDRAAMIRTLEVLLSAKATIRADGVAVLEKK